MITLYKHQQAALEIMTTGRGSNNFMLNWEMGCGKTLPMVMAILDKVQKHHARFLVIAPASVCQNWIKEIERVDRVLAAHSINIAGMSSVKRNKILSDAKYRVVIMNYEMFRVIEFKKFSPFNGIVYDEIHKLKNPQSVQTKAAIAFSAGMTWRYGLTGTMVVNNLMDVFSQMLCVDAGETFGKNFWEFRAIYFKDKNSGWRAKPGYFPDWVPKDSALNLITDKMTKIVDVKRKEECVDLPPQLFENRYCELTGPQLKAYMEMEKEMITFIQEQPAVARNALTRVLRLNQITAGHVVTDDGQLVMFDSSKLQLLEEVIDDLPGKKIIIWSVFKADIISVSKLLDKKKISFVALSGNTPVSERQGLIDSFQTADGPQVMIANIQTGGTGITLTAASHSIIYSMDYNLANYLQMLARNHRIGTTHEKITYVHLLAKNTVDEVVLNAIERKEDLADAVVANLKSKTYTARHSSKGGV